MSWFDTSGIANLAKSALKEAQKTIDKALDIKEDEASRANSRTSKDEQANNFFATWGIKSVEGRSEDDAAVVSSPEATKAHDIPGVWGSFTGSFFDSPKNDEFEAPRLDVPSGSSRSRAERDFSSSSSFDEKITRSHESPLISSEISKLHDKSRRKLASSVISLVKRISDDKPDASLEKRRYSASDLESRDETRNSNEKLSIRELFIDDREIREKIIIESRKRENESSNELEKSRIRLSLNRESFVSSESDKKSSESVEILDSRSNTNTNCTTSPESEITSSSISTNPTHCDTKRNSESVEILSDSNLASPCSVEILIDARSDDYPSPISLSSTPDARCANFSSILPIVAIIDNDDSSSDVSPYVSPIADEATNPGLTNDENLSNDDDQSISDSTRIGSIVVGDIVKEIPCSVAAIADNDEIDEASQAEDSYTSASEITIITCRETNMQKFDSTSKIRNDIDEMRMHDSCTESLRYVGSGTLPILDPSTSSSHDSTREKHNLVLPPEPITTQPFSNAETIAGTMCASHDGSSANERTRDACHVKTEFDSCVEQIRTKQPIELIADCPEQYPMLTDSSCEGTLIESSSDDNAILGKANETRIIDAPLSSSSYVKNMLADAMTEKGEINADAERHRSVDGHARENSPISSESRSDLVKIGSDQTSGHTSGDELETTTSSDIEIISRYSPNGDSSSTQSRQSPANLHSTKSTELLQRTFKTRGHSRELSEISVGSDEANFEMEKLLRRTQEMTEILQIRESKLIDVSRMNMELHEQNIHLKKQLDSMEMRAEHNYELSRITDDYTQRLSALEKKFQQAISERDGLREQLDSSRQEASARLSSRELSSIIGEKDDIIKELRDEGEKLSKQQLQHNNIIKKLRNKEKENDALIKSQKEQLEEQSSELERLKRSLHAKEEIERTQIEAVHTLTARIKKQETDILSLQEKLDNAVNKMDAYKTSLDATKADSVDVKAKLAIAEEELKRALENAGESCQLSAQVDDLKLKLRQSEEAHVRSVESLKLDSNELLKRLEKSEARNEELSESVTLATKPLLRQLEQLQSSFAMKTCNFTKQEKLMSDRIVDLQSKLENLVATDRSLVEENLSLKTKISALESRIKRNNSEKSQIEEALETLRSRYEKIAEENSRNRETMEKLVNSHDEETNELRREIKSLNDALSVERAATSAEKRRNNAFVEQQQSIDQESRLSPTLSIGRDSIGSTSSVWPAFNESLFESGSGRFPSVYDSLRAGGNSTSMIENLQAQVKQRDGEIQQLQWEISRRNNERNILNMELSSLTFKIEELTSKVTEIEALNASLNEIQTRYDALLQMYGEKIEETDELRLDLADVKEMYKSQIDQLLKRDT